MGEVTDDGSEAQEKIRYQEAVLKTALVNNAVLEKIAHKKKKINRKGYR